jgi:putative Holliday junction resolvase
MSTPGRLLALDVGEKRIGVALSDPLQILARPLTVIHRTSRADDFAKIGRLVDEQGAVQIVCGYPLSLDGSEGPQGRRVRRYAEALREAVAVPVVLWDESYSTAEAEEMMQATQPRLSPRERRHWIDAVAAAVILQSYLNARSQPDGTSPQDQP